jgi:hypothetical protein
MSITTHKCPAPTCDTRVSNLRLACRPHWCALPRHLQDAVHATADQSIFDPERADVLAQVVAFYASRGW